MSTAAGIDEKTYTISDGLAVNSTTNDKNYIGGSLSIGNINNTTINHFYTFSSVTSFTNNYVIMAAGGYATINKHGGHAIYNTSNGIKIFNYGALLGGGGSGGGIAGRFTQGNGAGGGGAPGGGGGGGAGGNFSTTDGNGGIGGYIITNYKNGANGIRQGGGGGGYVTGAGGSGGSITLSSITRAGGNGGSGGNIGNGSNSGSGSSGPDKSGGGGGGAFGGGGGNGGGGGGGGSGGGIAGNGDPNVYNNGGLGGYGIYNNNGTITDLYNSQGVNIYYGPLFYGGTSLPTNYYIRVNSTTNYGQLFCTGWSAIESVPCNIYIDPLSSIIIKSVTTLYSVLVGNCFTTTSGTVSLDNGMSITYSIIESTPTTVTVGPTSYKSYDLVINPPLSGYGIMAASSLTLSGYLNNPDPSISYYINGLNKTSTTAGMVSIQNSSNYVSLYANYVVASGTGFTINSDQRIKKNVEYLSSAESLKLVNALKPASFQYVDSMKGTVPKYGYLAQEVESVFPNIVYQNPAYIPDFYEIVKIEDSRRIILPTKNTGSLAIGTKLQFYDIQNAVILREVESIIDSKSFMVTEPFFIDTLFLYGQEVADYRSIDTDQINTVLLSALQETNKEIEELKQTVEDLVKRIDDYISGDNLYTSI